MTAGQKIDRAPVEVLVVDDDPGDTLLICEALAADPLSYRVARRRWP